MEIVKCILSIGFLVSIADSNIFTLNSKYFEDKPLCQELNRTLYSKIEGILEKRNGNINIFINKYLYILSRKFRVCCSQSYVS